MWKEKKFCVEQKKDRIEQFENSAFAEWQQQFHRFQCIAWAPKINLMRPTQCEKRKKNSSERKAVDLFKAIIYYSSIAFSELKKKKVVDDQTTKAK